MKTSSLFTQKSPIWLLLTVLLGGSLYIAGKLVETEQQRRITISVSGEGKVSAQPDIAQINFGVETGRYPKSHEAMQTLSKRMQAVIEAVKSHGIEEKDIATQNVSLQPAYDWKEGERIDRGFEASQTLRIKVRDLELLGTVLTAAAEAGANQAGNVNFTIDDPEELRALARAKAIRQAQSKAKTLAKQLNMRLGGITDFFEESGGFVAPMARTMMMESMGGGLPDTQPLPVPSGEQEITIRVNVGYALR